MDNDAWVSVTDERVSGKLRWVNRLKSAACYCSNSIISFIEINWRDRQYRCVIIACDRPARCHGKSNNDKYDCDDVGDDGNNDEDLQWFLLIIQFPTEISCLLLEARKKAHPGKIQRILRDHWNYLRNDIMKGLSILPFPVTSDVQIEYIQTQMR